jgi:hypothetical protein
MAYQYSYLLGDVVLLIIWLTLFSWRKDVRKEMIVISSIFGFVGLFAEFIYTIDWWRPLTITLTRIGVEDFLFGFTVAGIASVIYEEVLKKKVRIRKVSKKRALEENKNFLVVCLSLIILFFGSFFLLKIHSFYASIIAFTLPTFYMWMKRRDLIIDSLASGFFLMIISFLGFIIPEMITPGWVQSVWYLENLSGIIILKAPLEDIIWFFLAGAFIGPLYEFWKEGKLRRIK